MQMGRARIGEFQIIVQKDLDFPGICRDLVKALFGQMVQVPAIAIINVFILLVISDD